MVTRRGVFALVVVGACAQLEVPAESPPIAERVLYVGPGGHYRLDEDHWRDSVQRVFEPGISSAALSEELRAQGFVLSRVNENGWNAKYSWPAPEGYEPANCQPNAGILWNEGEDGEATLVASMVANC